MREEGLAGKFARKILALQEYNFTISHIKGVNNCVVDALSRDPCTGHRERTRILCFAKYEAIGQHCRRVEFPAEVGPSTKANF